MTLATAVVQVVGRLGAADPVAATARSWQARLAGLDARTAVMGPDGVGRGGTGPEELVDGPALVVHTVDGGEALAPLLPHLHGRRLTLVHHGSAQGSDRLVLRALRGHTETALAANAAAREELRALGFADVRPLDPELADLGSIDPDPATVEALAGHPAPRLLCVGPVGPNRGIELLLDAFEVLLTRHEAGAILSICGSSTPWYRQQLHGTIIRRGLLACEVVEPADDAEVVARLDDAAALVALRPTGLDPYVRAAVERGLPVVAPVVADAAWIPAGALVAVPRRADAAALAAALATGISMGGRPVPPATRGPSSAEADQRLLAALGLR